MSTDSSSALQRMQALNAEMESLRTQAIAELELKKNALFDQIAALDAEIASLGGKPVKSAGATGRTRRRSLTDEEITEKIRILLGDGKAMSGKEIQDNIGIPFSRFKSWMSANPILLNKGTGKSNSRYILSAKR